MNDSRNLNTPITKRQFLRRVSAGGAVLFVASGGYQKPELETLLGPQVARAATSGHNTPGGPTQSSADSLYGQDGGGPSDAPPAPKIVVAR